MSYPMLTLFARCGGHVLAIFARRTLKLHACYCHLLILHSSGHLVPRRVMRVWHGDGRYPKIVDEERL